MAGVDGCNSRLKWRGVFAGERPLAEVCDSAEVWC